MRASDIAFVGALVHRFPELRPFFQEHLDDFDEVLSHVFMAEITRWVVAEFQRDPESKTLREVLDFIEENFVGGHEHVKELIGASFVENLPTSDEEGFGVRERLGPALRNA